MPSLKHNGKRHLPLPEGPYTVGCTDVMTGCSKRGCFMRLYYPCAQTGILEYHDQWPLWSINRNYISGQASFSPFPHFIAERAYRLLCGTAYIPAILDATPLSEGQKFPVIIFSHGLAACRGTYSAILTELASHGYIVAAVEHRDYSACYSYYVKISRMSKYGPYPGSDISEVDREILDQEDDLEHAEKYRHASLGKKRHGVNTSTSIPVPFHISSASWKYAPYRNMQVHKRAGECVRVLDLLQDINDGIAVRNVLETNCNLQRFKGLMDVSRVAIAGHSFGGATVLMALAADSRFKVGVTLDAWMVPIEMEEDLPSLVKQPILFINSTRFYTNRTMRGLKKFESDQIERKYVTVRGTTHISQCDVPYIVPKGLNIFMGGIIIGNRFVHLNVTKKLMMQFVEKHLGLPVKPTHQDFVNKTSSYIKEGFSINYISHLFL